MLAGDGVRDLAADRLVADRADGVDVGERALAGAENLFRRCVAAREDLGEAVCLLATRLARGAEIDQHRADVVAQQDIRRLDIAVHQPGLVDHGEAGQDLGQDAAQVFLRHAAGVVAQGCLKRAADDVFHHHVGGTVRLEERLHPHDVGLAGAGAAKADQGARLIDEAAAAIIEDLGLAGRGGVHLHALADGKLAREVFLEGKKLAQQVLGQIGHAKAAAAEQADNAIAVQHRALGEHVVRPDGVVARSLVAHRGGTSDRGIEAGLLLLGSGLLGSGLLGSGLLGSRLGGFAGGNLADRQRPHHNSSGEFTAIPARHAGAAKEDTR